MRKTRKKKRKCVLTLAKCPSREALCFFSRRHLTVCLLLARHCLRLLRKKTFLPSTVFLRSPPRHVSFEKEKKKHIFLKTDTFFRRSFKKKHHHGNDEPWHMWMTTNTNKRNTVNREETCVKECYCSVRNISREEYYNCFHLSKVYFS